MNLEDVEEPADFCRFFRGFVGVFTGLYRFYTVFRWVYRGVLVQQKLINH